MSAAMKKLAEHTEHASADDDFEVLVGAFVSLSEALDQLTELASVAETDPDLARSLVKSGLFVRRVRDNGISHVLEIIAERSVATGPNTVPMERLVSEIVAQFDGTVTFGNLNYDTLLLSTLMDHDTDLCDMGNGFGKASYTDRYGTKHTDVRPLRTSNNFPTDRRIRLLHLHGSLTFWRRRAGGVFKLPTHLLRNGDLWSGVRETRVTIRPEVILANQHDKSELIRKRPYALAYSAFAHSLGHSDHWLIIGYSFRDVCLNERLLHAMLQRKDSPPQVLISTFGDDLTRAQILKAFGWSVKADGPATWLTVNRDGAFDLVDSSEWLGFVWPPLAIAG